MIQTVKLSLFEVIVHHSFPVAPFTEVTFLARESFVIQNDQNAPASRCLLSLKRQNRQIYKKRSLRFYLTQSRDSNGELSLFEVNIVYRSFPIALFTEVSFLPRESFVECAGESVFVVF